MKRVEPDPSSRHCIVALIHSKPCFKEVPQKSLYKKTNWMWKLFILIFLGLCGVYIGLAGFEQQKIYPKIQIGYSVAGKLESKSACSRNNVKPERGLQVHYPQPATYDRERCRCTPVHYFVIFSMQRTGSGWFEALLNSHPNVSCHGEVFSIEARRDNFSTIKRTLDTVYNLDWVSSASKNECTVAVGLKWMLNQGVMEYKKEVATYLKDKAVSVIFLFRRNILKRYVSILANTFDRDAKLSNGTHQSHVHSREEANVLAAYKPVVNLTSLITYLHHVEEIMNDAQLFYNDTRHMTLYYEDLVKNPKVLKSAQEFLGVRPQKLESKHVKIHTLPLSDQVQNWSDLSGRLKETKYEILLNGKDYR